MMIDVTNIERNTVDNTLNIIALITRSSQALTANHSGNPSTAALNLAATHAAATSPADDPATSGAATANPSVALANLSRTHAATNSSISGALALLCCAFAAVGAPWTSSSTSMATSDTEVSNPSAAAFFLDAFAGLADLLEDAGPLFRAESAVFFLPLLPLVFFRFSDLPPFSGIVDKSGHAPAGAARRGTLGSPSRFFGQLPHTQMFVRVLFLPTTPAYLWVHICGEGQNPGCLRPGIVSRSPSVHSMAGRHTFSRGFCIETAS